MINYCLFDNLNQVFSRNIIWCFLMWKCSPFKNPDGTQCTEQENNSLTQPLNLIEADGNYLFGVSLNDRWKWMMASMNRALLFMQLRASNHGQRAGVKRMRPNLHHCSVLSAHHLDWRHLHSESHADCKNRRSHSRWQSMLTVEQFSENDAMPEIMTD